MKIKISTYSLLAFMFTIGCTKEPTQQPLEMEPMYVLPQGNHEFDKKIVEFHKTYGCYILYKFTEKDFRWNITTNILLMAEQAEEEHVESALNALDRYLFKFYPTDLLKKAMPYKIILASRIRTILFTNVIPYVMADNYVNTTSTYSHMAFGRAGSTLPTLTAAQLKVMKAELHREFWRQAVVYNKVDIPPVFAKATDYSIVTNVLPVRRANGIFTTISNKQTVAGDFADYMYNIALQTPQEWEQSVFNALNDPNGKFRLKYNAIVSHFKTTYGIDLQTIAATQ